MLDEIYAAAGQKLEAQPASNTAQYRLWFQLDMGEEIKAAMPRLTRWEKICNLVIDNTDGPWLLHLPFRRAWRRNLRLERAIEQKMFREWCAGRGYPDPGPHHAFDIQDRELAGMRHVAAANWEAFQKGEPPPYPIAAEPSQEVETPVQRELPCEPVAPKVVAAPKVVVPPEPVATTVDGVVPWDHYQNTTFESVEERLHQITQSVFMDNFRHIPYRTDNVDTRAHLRTLEHRGAVYSDNQTPEGFYVTATGEQMARSYAAAQAEISMAETKREERLAKQARKKRR